MVKERNVDTDKLRGRNGKKAERDRKSERVRKGGREGAREGDMEASVNIFTQAC